ncbi:hypothetical protein GCM10010297_22840 [Streptomyces malachitofuscus]|nr:hypothetical protein GCM10010297_22840 [Streptomyces malachitofuscus]
MCRDRAPFFAEGAPAGAPQATPLADRLHSWHNFGEAAERAVARHRRRLRAPVPDRETKAERPAPPEEKATSPRRSDRFAHRVRARHATLHALPEWRACAAGWGKACRALHNLRAWRPARVSAAVPSAAFSIGAADPRRAAQSSRAKKAA